MAKYTLYIPFFVPKNGFGDQFQVQNQNWLHFGAAI